jgi:tRNA (guanosine-2'-O-)-methyltransferase
MLLTLFERLADRFVLGRRLERFRTVLDQRTLWIVPVLENIRKAHNASAVVRTCDALGVAAVHFVEYENEFALNPQISKGAHDWVEQRAWTSSDECFDWFRQQGYLIVGTTLHEDAVHPKDLPIDRPLALILGNEKNGLSKRAIAECDCLVCLPMRGFVESMNVSVAAALIMHGHLERVRAIGDDRWKLPVGDRKRILRRWIFFCTRVGGIIRKMRLKKRIEAGIAAGDAED